MTYTGEKQNAYQREWRRRDIEGYRAHQRAWLAADKLANPEKYRLRREADRERDAARAKERTAALPPIVYVWVAPDGTADYVGRGTIERAKTHRRKSWWTPTHLLLTMACASEWEAMELEGRWGARYLPRHNVEGYRHQNLREMN